MPSYYESLGYKRSPFFREALEPYKTDFEVFIGRTKDVRNFLSILNPDSGVHLISGKRGVGKTSFVNAIQYMTSLSAEEIKNLNEQYKIHYYPENMLPCFRKIQLEEDDSIDKVLLKVISSIIFSLDQFLREKQKNGTVSSDPIRQEREEFQKLIASSLSNAEKKIDVNTKYDLLTRLISSIKSNTPRNGIYLVIDNLDIVDIAVSTRILNELRDYVFIPGLCTIMMGPEGIYTDLRSTVDGARIIDRVAGQENILHALDVDETIQILNARRIVFAKDKQHPPDIPLDLNYVRDLYSITGGQMRLLFKLCETICTTVLSQYPSITSISGENAATYLKTVVQNETKISSYSKKELEFLKACLDKPMRPKEYNNLKLDSGMHFIRIANRLIQDELITKQMVGVAVYYAPTALLNLSRYVGLI